MTKLKVSLWSLPAIAHMSGWGRGLCLTATGVNADQRQHVREVIEGAGGRYTPNFSKRCTHLIVAGEQNDTSRVKVYLAGVNKEKWQAHAVRLEWLEDCTHNSCQVAEGPYTVEPPSPKRFHTLQQRLQQVAVPTVSKAASGFGDAVETVPSSGPQKRICSDLDVHTNITTRPSSRLPSKRHKPASLPAPESNVSSSLAQAKSQSKPCAHEFVAPCKAALPGEHTIHHMASDSHPSAAIIPAQALLQQPACIPAAHQPFCPISGNSAGLTAHNTRQQQATSQTLRGVASQMAMQTATGTLQASSGRQEATAIGIAKACAAPVPAYFSSTQYAAAGQDIAAKMHVLQAQAMDMAWQQQQAPAAAQIKRGTAATGSVDAVSSTCLQHASRTSRSAAVQGADGQDKLSSVTSTAAQQRLKAAAHTPLPADPLVEIHGSHHQQQQQQHQQPQSSHQLETPITCRSADLSADTESLVVKLRALSANRDANSQTTKGKAAHVAQQGFVYKAKSGKCCHKDTHDTPVSNTSSIRHPLAPVHKDQRPPVAASASMACSMASLSRCSSSATEQHQPHHPAQPGRCPLHAALSVKQEAQQPPFASTSGHKRSCQAHASSAQASSVIVSQHEPVLQSSRLPAATATVPANSTEDVTEAAAYSNVPDVPMNPRLGKVTPLKGSFTPRPSRFRLEAERCTPTSRSRPDQLQQALFSSPIKQANMTHLFDADAECVGSASAPVAAAVPAEHSRDYRALIEPAEPATQMVDGGMPADVAAPNSMETPSAVPAVFSNMHFILDSDFLPDQQHRMSEAIKQGGGQQVANAYLGSGATHVVCQPEAASKWLSMGLSIVSPAWLLRSLSLGTPQRCLHLSLDASRHLPTPGPTPTPAVTPCPQPAADHANLGCDLTTRQARQDVLQQLHGIQSQLHGGAKHAQQAVQTPQSMLDEVLWSISEPAEQARLDPTHPAFAVSAQHSTRSAADCEDFMEMMTATQVACEAELCDAEAMCIDSSSSQAAAAIPGQLLQEQDWQEVVYRGASLTVLLPVDSSGACGHCSRTVQTDSRGVTRQQLLQSIFSFYQEDLSIAEQLQLLQRSRHAAEVLEDAFVEGATVKRLALMGSKTSFEGLERVSRDLTGTIYEAKLSC